MPTIAYSRRRWLSCFIAGMLSIRPMALAEAQQGTKRLAYLAGGKADQQTPYRRALMAALSERGWVEGSNLIVDMRHADGDPARSAALTDELLATGPDVFLVASDLYAVSAARANKTLPVVFVIGFDPVGLGLVRSLASPGGNVTGMSAVIDELTGKRLSLLKQTLPAMQRVGVLIRDGDERARHVFDSTQQVARGAGITLVAVPFRSREDLPTSIARAADAGVTALIAVPDPLQLSERKLIAEVCLHRRLATAFGSSEFADAGMLMAYAPDFIWMYSRAGHLVDRIFRGALPAQIPVEQPTVFEFVINLKTARALGITVPTTVLLQATRVIE